MKRTILLVAVALIGMITVQSCKKYPDGPALTIRSKTNRLANEWVIHKVYTEGVDVTNIWNTIYQNYLFNIRKDFYWELTLNSDNVESSGTWAFDEEKEQLILTETGNPTPLVYDILRLKHAELWLRQTIGNEETELQLIPVQD